MTYYSALMAVVAPQTWVRVSPTGERSFQPAFVVVHCALREYRGEARAAIERGHFHLSATGARYERTEP